MPMTAEEVQQLYDDAAAAYSAGDFARAGEMFSTLLIEPEALEGSNEVHWNYAMCLAHEGNWPLAIEHVRAGGYDVAQFREVCREWNLRDAEHDFEEASQLYQNQQWDAAADAFTELMLHSALDSSTLPQLHWNIAMCLAHTGQLETALAHVRESGYSEADFRAACQQSNVDLARHQFDSASELYNQGRWNEAADAFAELLISPGTSSDEMDELQWNLAMCFAQLGNWDTAFGHIRASGGDEREFRDAAVNAGLQPPDDGSGY
jgi:tetratricopeptide (TPR) repeat protein